MASYRYDAQGRRVEYIDETRNVTVRYAYDGANAIVEYEYDSSSLTGTRSYVHGTQYIDERAVMRDHAQDPVAGDYQNGQDHYYLLKDLYTVAGLVGCNGGPEEYYVYDTYGHVTIYAWPVGTSASWESTSDLDRSGGVSITDQSAIKTARLSGDTNPFWDVNFSGDLTLDDDAVVAAAVVSAPLPVQVNYSTVGNPYFFTGRLTDTLHADDLVAANDPDGVKRLQDNRNRMYDPRHGRWLQRDPAGYVDGMNLYEYVTSNPVLHLDPLGFGIIIPGPRPPAIPPGYPRDPQNGGRQAESRALMHARQAAERLAAEYNRQTYELASAAWPGPDYHAAGVDVRHGIKSCLPKDKCEVLVAKMTLWVLAGAQRRAHLISDKYDFKNTDPQKYNNHVDELDNVNYQMNKCWQYMLCNCRKDGEFKLKYACPRAFPLPEKVPVPSASGNSNRSQELIGDGAVVVGVGGAGYTVYRSIGGAAKVLEFFKALPDLAISRFVILVPRTSLMPLEDYCYSTMHHYQ